MIARPKKKQRSEPGPDRACESGIRPRITDERLHAAARADAASLVHASLSVRSVFPRVIDILQRLVPIRAAACVPRDPGARPVVWTASRHERTLVEAEAVATATLAYFDEQTATDRSDPFAYGAMGRLPWVTLPIADDSANVLGALAVVTEQMHVDERAVGTIAAIARELAPLLDRRRRRGFSVEDRSATAEARARFGNELSVAMFDRLD
jgi:hypothetical protein